MQNSEEILQKYIQKMLQIQEKQQNKPMTNEELKNIALDMGMGEEDWQKAQDMSQGYLKNGNGHLRYGNWQDAADQLEQALTLIPYSLEANYGLAKAYEGIWLDSGEEGWIHKIKRHVDQVLQIQPGHLPSLEILNTIRRQQSIEKKNKGRVVKNLLPGVGVILLLAGISYGWIYNAIIQKNEQVEKRWAQVENVCQRRVDLIPSLVSLLKKEIKIEEKKLDKVLQMYQEIKNLEAGNIKDFSDYISDFSSRQHRLSLFLISLQDEITTSSSLSKSFAELRVQMEGAENRITVERKKFNETVTEYNSFVKKFPANLLGFTSKPYFKMQREADKNKLYLE